MSAQPVEPSLPGRVHRVPRTVAGIGEWLTEEKRAAFLAEVMAAKEEDDFKRVMDRWWAEAHLDQAPERRERRDWALTADRSELVSLEEIMRRSRSREGAG
ncbi:hypothetical protein ACGFJT_24890 [Actinomadura geliboluensis]|uniref:hypothetical protein n=1 Tax=Actinomadura geliboluensis TaxID=882440 RepID=UPI003712712E